jgi:hypothetical protein
MILRFKREKMKKKFGVIKVFCTFAAVFKDNTA